MSKDLAELEAELVLAEAEDEYAKSVYKKTDIKMLTSNFLENKEQARISKLGGTVLA